MQTVAIQKKAAPIPPLLLCPLPAEVVFFFCFALLNLVYRFLWIYRAFFPLFNNYFVKSLAGLCSARVRKPAV